jgi:hypothetical protein
MRRTRLVLLSLTILVCMAWPMAASGHALPARTIKPTLCGKLAFLEDAKTGAKLIGLIPCGESRPIIFQRRPSELLEYYRFKDAAIVSGPAVRTTTYGTISDYITRFDSYTAINSCNDCRPAVPGVRPAGSSPDLACSAWALTSLAADHPALAALPAFQEIEQNLGYFAKGQVLRQKCGLETVCQEREIHRQLGARLGPLLRQQQLTHVDVIAMLSGLLEKADQAQDCANPGSLVLNAVATLNQQGYAIDALSLSAEASMLASDAQGAQAGMDGQGKPVANIPGSQLVTGDQNSYLLLLADQLASLELRGQQNGAATLETVLNRGDTIQYALFKNFPVYAATLGELDLSAAPPVLQLDAWGKGQFQPRQATFAEDGGRVVARLAPPTPVNTTTPTDAPPTATTQPSPTFTASPTTLPTTLPTSTVPAALTPAPQATPGNLCPLVFGVALLPGALWLGKSKSANILRRRKANVSNCDT